VNAETVNNDNNNFKKMEKLKNEQLAEETGLSPSH